MKKFNVKVVIVFICITVFCFFGCETLDNYYTSFDDFTISGEKSLINLLTSLNISTDYKNATIKPTEAKYRELFNSTIQVEFIYHIAYSQVYDSWLISLFGRNTSLFLEMTKNRSVAIEKKLLLVDITPDVNTWMSSNSVNDLDYCIRVFNGFSIQRIELDGEIILEK